MTILSSPAVPPCRGASLRARPRLPVPLSLLVNAVVLSGAVACNGGDSGSGSGGSATQAGSDVATGGATSQQPHAGGAGGILPGGTGGVQASGAGGSTQNGAGGTGGATPSGVGGSAPSGVGGSAPNGVGGATPSGPGGADGATPSGTGGGDTGAGGMGPGGFGGTASSGAGGATTGGAGGAGAAAAAGAGGESGAGDLPGTERPDEEASRSAVEGLRGWLAEPRGARPALAGEPFASTPLIASDAQTAAELLWEDLSAWIVEERQGEVESQAITLDGFTLRYETVLLGDEPEAGRSLFISMHGGGNAPAATNDEQWRNQVALATSYAPEDALWVAPRAPTDDWNMWFKDHIDPLFDRLITNMIVFEGIDPNKVYLTGYSAGGDGVYQLGPRMADRWAAAAMSAGHPNDASPLNLRNIGFAIHVGGDDTAYSRNEIVLEWGAQLDELQGADQAGYAHQVEVHPGLPHWMNLADGVSIPFVQSFERDPAPKRVVWRQSGVTSKRFYWLSVDEANEASGTEIVATVNGASIDVEASGVDGLTLRLSDALLDLNAPIAVSVNGEPRFEGFVPRTIGVIHATLSEREDPAMVYAAEVRVDAQ